MDDGLVLSDKCLFTGPENWTYCTACVNSVAKCIILLNTLHKNFKNLNKKKKEIIKETLGKTDTNELAFHSIEH